MFTHTCHEAKFKCDVCEYGGQNQESMNVHIGRNHSDKLYILASYVSIRQQKRANYRDTLICYIIVKMIIQLIILN